jgi:hypothetical protein
MCLNEAHSKVRISKYLSDHFLIQNGLKHGDALSPLLFNFASGYIIMKVQGHQVGLKLNGTYQLLVYADDVSLLGANIDTVKKCTQSLIDASKEVGLEINAQKAKYMLLSRHQDAGQNHDRKISNRCFENVAQFKHMGTTVTYQNLIREEMKRGLNSDNACYHSAQNFLFSCLLSRNLKIGIYKTIIFPVVLYGCENCL